MIGEKSGKGIPLDPSHSNTVPLGEKSGRGMFNVQKRGMWSRYIDYDLTLTALKL